MLSMVVWNISVDMGFFSQSGALIDCIGNVKEEKNGLLKFLTYEQCRRVSSVCTVMLIVAINGPDEKFLSLHCLLVGCKMHCYIILE